MTVTETNPCDRRSPGVFPDADYVDNFSDIHPPLTPHEALGGSRSLLFLLRCALHDGLSDLDRHSDVHSQDPGRQSGRIRENHLRSEHSWVACAPVSAPPKPCAKRSVCARVAEGKPVKIGLLQRHATDTFMEREQPHPFTRAAPTGKKIAVIGAGPAGLSCAHRLAMHLAMTSPYSRHGRNPAALTNMASPPTRRPTTLPRMKLSSSLQIGGITIENGKALGPRYHVRCS
jgi:dihydropyrimidine dehydrogenase (NAD+) subunit PreT